MLTNKSLNYKVLFIFAPILILIGAAGFVIPKEKAVTSGAAAYNIFHLIFGAIGILLLILKKEKLIYLFNIGFGLLDLYQAVAAFTNLFPIRQFQWTRVDDLLHVVIGSILIAVGIYGFTAQKQAKI